MSTFLPAEKGMTIREPSTANFLIDSTDRDGNRYPSSADFQINANQALLNGFFTRLAPVEIVLDWCVDNISDATDNSGISVNVGGTDYVATLAEGQYNVQQALDAIVVALNAAGTGLTFSVGGVAGASGQKTLAATGSFTINDTNLAREMSFQIGVAGTEFPLNCPLLLPYTYIDFVSTQLTYNQDLKDATTNFVKRDVLYRWYFAWDGPSPLDTYGYPINQGYQRFIQRRYIPYPKQIRWDNIQPVGNIAFQVFSSQGSVLSYGATIGGEFEWKMTLLVSEC